MDRKTILEALEDMRGIQFRCWEDYREDVKTRGKAFRPLMAEADRNVRVLDYIITEVRKLDAV